MLTIDRISKKFGKLKVLDQISVAFSSGQTVSLVGPNGSGKTTLIKCILGLVLPDVGNIIVNGMAAANGFDYRRHIGYMPQIGRYPDNMRVAQVFDMIREIRSDFTGSSDDDLIRAFGVAAFENKSMSALSGGMRQKVSACLAFMFQPPILILDEPTAGLDPLASEVLKEKLMAEKAKGKLILITSHILSDFDELTSHILYLMEGKKALFQPVEALREHTGEARLNRAIAQLMKQHA